MPPRVFWPIIATVIAAAAITVMIATQFSVPMTVLALVALGLAVAFRILAAIAR